MDRCRTRGTGSTRSFDMYREKTKRKWHPQLFFEKPDSVYNTLLPNDAGGWRRIERLLR